MIIVRVQRDRLHFSITAPCGCGWVGMRHSDDVRIQLDRAMDHECQQSEPGRYEYPDSAALVDEIDRD